MNIYVAKGEGHGTTLLSAFDSALKDANVYNYNLIALSSIIPPGSIIRNQKIKPKEDEYGYKLYVVKAEMRSRETGKYIGAAIGWYQLADGRGVFVEHEEIGETKDAVESSLAQDIKKSIADMCKFRKVSFKERKLKMKLNIVKVEDIAACALVIAVYKAEGWGANAS